MVDEQYNLAEYLMRDASLPCLKCGSDDTETCGYYDDHIVCEVIFKCFDCRYESKHIMGLEPHYWVKVKEVRGSKESANK